MTVDREYCMSSFLMFRTIASHDKCFAEGVIPNFWKDNRERNLVYNYPDLEKQLEKYVSTSCQNTRAALALSGGIDSAILARFMPRGSVAYTFRCVVPGISVTDETSSAARYAIKCGLEHRIIEIYWEDFERFAPILMKHKGAPIHSIEVQIYKAAIMAKADGIESIIFGESADLNYGGLSDLLSKDRQIGDFIDRYNYVQPHHVLKNPVLITDPYKEYVEDGIINTHEFCRGFFLREAMGSYSNACACAGIALETPYVHTWLATPLDLSRIRAGENKYVIRDAFAHLYPGFEIPQKTPMPRPMDEWMAKWSGPMRDEFWPHCTDRMTGDQKWYVWALERFLTQLDEMV